MKSQTTGTISTGLNQSVKAVRVFSVLIMLVIFGSVSAFAQATGDYRSAVTGNWNTLATWQRYNGTTWATPTAGQGYPGQNASPTTVTVQNAHTITLNVSPANAITNLVVGSGASGTLTTDATARTISVATNVRVNAGATLNLNAMTITNNGTTDVYGTLTDASTTGANTFVGKVTIHNGGSFTIATNETVVFRGGIENNGTFNKTGTGTTTFNTNSQSIDGSGSYTMNGVITVTGVTVTNNSTSFNHTSTAANAITGTGIWRQGTGSVLNTAAASINISTFDCSTNVNTVSFNRNNAQNIPAATFHNLIIANGNTKTLVGNVTVNNDFTLASGTTFNPAGFNLTISGNTLLAGTFADGTVAGTTSFQNVNLSGGSINGGATGIVNINGNLSIASANGTLGRATITINGTTNISASRSLTLNSNTGVKTFAGAVTNDGTWTSTTITTAANLVFQNGFTNNSATNVAIGGATFSTNNQELAGSGSFTFANTSFISGAITLTNNSSHVNGVTFTGTINGTIAGSTLANGANRSLYYRNATQPMATGILDASAVGNSFYYSLNNAQTVKGATYHNLLIQSGNTKTLGGNVTVNNDFTLAAATTVNPVGFDMSVSGSTALTGLINDNNASGTVSFADVNLSGGTITGSVASAVNINGTLSVASANGTIGLVTLTVNGATSISASRTLTLNSNTGVKTFVGAVTNAGTWTSTTITTAANLVFQNGFTNNSATTAALGAATFSTNNQALAGTGSFTFANPVIVSGAITLTNNSSSASGVTFNNTVDGTIAGSTLANGINAIINYQPAVATQPMNTGLLDVSASGNTFNYNRNNAQTVKAATYHNLGILNGNTKSLAGATVVNGNLIIANITTLDITASNYALSVGGNFSNSGTFNARNGTVTFNGSVSQSITPNASSFYNIVFNNSANGTSAILLNADVTITNTATLTDGIISTSANRLILSNNSAASLSGGSAASYVNGNLRRNIATNTSTYAFPVGSSANYFRADIKNNNLTGITYIDAAYSILTRHDDVDLDVNDGPALTYVSIAPSMWTIDPNAAPSGGSYDVYLYTGNVSGLTDNEFAVLKRPTGSPDGTSWTTGGGTINAGGGDGRKLSDGYALRMGLTSFSEFGIGSTTPSNPLPIQLVSFDVKMNKTGVADLTWVTATEVNNDFFTIERSVNGVNFEEVKTIKGAGNSSRTLTYKTTDAKPLKGVSYYRLKQTDYDGTYTYSNIVSLTNNGLVSTASVAQNWTVYPNPMNAGGFMNIYTENYEAKATVTVYEATTGKQVVEATIESENTSLSLDENVKPGIYLVRIVSGETTTTKRMIIQ